MKRLFALLLALALAGCAAAPRPGTDPVWQAELAGGGTLAVSGCTVAETQAALWQGQEVLAEALPLLAIDGVPTLTLTGVEEGDVALAYIVPAGEDWQLYEAYIPVEKLDYVLAREADGTLVYRLDTVYGYRLTVGDEQWLLEVRRDGL